MQIYFVLYFIFEIFINVQLFISKRRFGFRTERLGGAWICSKTDLTLRSYTISCSSAILFSDTEPHCNRGILWACGVIDITKAVRIKRYFRLHSQFCLYVYIIACIGWKRIRWLINKKKSVFEPLSYHRLHLYNNLHTPIKFQSLKK